jgi:hypothetical protein
MKFLILSLLFLMISCNEQKKPDAMPLKQKLDEVAKDVLNNNNEGCACMEMWEPVCGVDGKTYGNSCEAECKNIKIAKKGEC